MFQDSVKHKKISLVLFCRSENSSKHLSLSSQIALNLVLVKVLSGLGKTCNQNPNSQNHWLDLSVCEGRIRLKQEMLPFQEHLNYVTEISLEELYILDPELVVKETVGTSPSMPDLVDSEEQQEQFAFPSSPPSPTSASR